MNFYLISIYTYGCIEPLTDMKNIRSDRLLKMINEPPAFPKQYNRIYYL